MPNSTAGQAKYLSVRNKDTYHQWTIARSITHLLRVTMIRPEKNIPDVLKASKCTRMSRIRLIIRGTRDGPFDSLYQFFGRENGTSKEASLGSSCEFFMDDILQSEINEIFKEVDKLAGRHYVTLSVIASHLSPIHEEIVHRNLQ